MSPRLLGDLKSIGPDWVLGAGSWSRSWGSTSLEPNPSQALGAGPGKPGGRSSPSLVLVLDFGLGTAPGVGRDEGRKDGCRPPYSSTPTDLPGLGGAGGGGGRET